VAQTGYGAPTRRAFLPRFLILLVGGYLAGSGVSGDGGWVPVFAGQRRPFEPGHVLSTTHGGRSERRLVPLAEVLAAELLADPGTPDYVREPSYRASVLAWARAEAMVVLLSDFLSGQDVEAGLTEVTRSRERETAERRGEGGAGRVRRVSESRRTASVIEQLRRAEILAMHLRDRLGLAPLARARLGKDVAAARLDLAALWAEQERAVAAPAGAAGAERGLGVSGRA
jgi:hypothetical protein